MIIPLSGSSCRQHLLILLSFVSTGFLGPLIFLVLWSNMGHFEYYVINLICFRPQVLTCLLLWVSSAHSQFKGESRTSCADLKEFFLQFPMTTPHTLWCPQAFALVLELETWGFSFPILSHISSAVSTFRIKQ